MFKDYAKTCRRLKPSRSYVLCEKIDEFVVRSGEVLFCPKIREEKTDESVPKKKGRSKGVTESLFCQYFQSRFAFAFGNQNGTATIAPNIHRGTQHIQNTIDGQNQTDSLQR